MTPLLRRIVANRRLGVRNFAYEGLVSGPARVKVSTPELLAHMAVLFVGTLAIPVYISYNIKHYRR